LQELAGYSKDVYHKLAKKKINSKFVTVVF